MPANFVNELLVEQGQMDEEVLSQGITAVNPYIVDQFRKRLQELMVKYTMENPELYQAVMKHCDLKDQLKQLMDE